MNNFLFKYIQKNFYSILLKYTHNKCFIILIYSNNITSVMLCLIINLVYFLLYFNLICNYKQYYIYFCQHNHFTHIVSY